MKTYGLRDSAVTSFVAIIQSTWRSLYLLQGKYPNQTKERLEILQESIVTEIIFGRKKSIFHRIIPPSTPN